MGIRTKLKDREMPMYSNGEEIFNMVSHIVGSVLRFYCNCVMYCIWSMAS